MVQIPKQQSAQIKIYTLAPRQKYGDLTQNQCSFSQIGHLDCSCHTAIIIFIFGLFKVLYLYSKSAITMPIDARQIVTAKRTQEYHPFGGCQTLTEKLQHIETVGPARAINQ